MDLSFFFIITNPNFGDYIENQTSFPRSLKFICTFSTAWIEMLRTLRLDELRLQDMCSTIHELDYLWGEFLSGRNFRPPKSP